ncbi:formimidoylglutamate deiminase [Acetobacter sp. TBRC 12305]|uniref:Formimidoylglutamate deiminase n=1 Tax=Acetobacter garciniae TaxID=2817435 RepID=A0A939HN73_9PROT|nr:formimidoylglutamate deiminase [Acetobacter garciniae]MBO1324502.1 formimidoylglutamate deiminase [Acetobacter garciniae]MBX0344191.1 formimidoylglutamate deiminase [Acetobacter garciniae]
MSQSVGSSSFFAKQALLPDGWHDNVRLSFDAQGFFTQVEPQGRPQPQDIRADIALPPLPSLHSHAFQRAMAGLTEARHHPSDSFWTWREQMYGLAARITPDTLRAIAARLYMDMLKAGFTQVAEFHYLHNAPDGAAYAQPAEMALSVIEGARQAGIGMTMLPTLYRHAGFGRPLAPEQKRFASTPDFIARILSDIAAQYPDHPAVRTGVALHSLRAVSDADMREMLRLAPQDCPIHIHIAEQVKEVEDCERALGRRPVAWLLDEMPVDARWCLVHATHLDAQETTRLARSGAVAGLCPITEANLGDGLFPLEKYIDAGGRFGIGSDSNVLLSTAEELRLLEYGQRLATQKRCQALPTGQTGSIGQFLYSQALAGGAQACGLGAAHPASPGAPVGPAAAGQLAVGQRADACILREDDLSLPGLKGDAVLDSAIFASPTLPVSDVLCHGAWVVRDGRHINEIHITAAFRHAIMALRS